MSFRGVLQGPSPLPAERAIGSAVRGGTPRTQRRSCAAPEKKRGESEPAHSIASAATASPSHGGDGGIARRLPSLGFDRRSAARRQRVFSSSSKRACSPCCAKYAFT